MLANVSSLAFLSGGVFASTNTDDLFVLVGFFSDRSFSRRRVIVGQILGIAAIVAISLAAASVALAISPQRVGFLGLAPIAIGIDKLRRLGKSNVGRQATAGGVIQVAAVTIANGADNIGVYTPIFASQRPLETAGTVAIFAVLTLAWCFAALWLASHAALGGPIQRFGRVLLPFVLIGLGGLILYRSGAVDIALRFVGSPL
jgi:cadmium resistance protein CadD (predicted permease)